jgi:hypothetical protein
MWDAHPRHPQQQQQGALAARKGLALVVSSNVMTSSSMLIKNVSWCISCSQ